MIANLWNKGDELTVTRRLFAKYLKLSQAYYANTPAMNQLREERSFENLGEE